MKSAQVKIKPSRSHNSALAKKSSSTSSEDYSHYKPRCFLREQYELFFSNPDDFQYFMENIFKLSKSPDIMAYEMKMHKLETSTLTENDFISLYERNPMKALESLFFERATMDDSYIFEKMRKMKELSLSDIYRQKKYNIEVGMMQMVL